MKRAYNPLDMFKYTAVSVYLNTLTVQCGTAHQIKSVVPMDVGIYVRLLRTCPSSVPEGRQGVQSGTEISSWRWLQHMVNFHNYSLPA